MVNFNIYRKRKIEGFEGEIEELILKLKILYEECEGNRTLFRALNPIKCVTYIFNGSTRLDKLTYKRVYFDTSTPWGKALYEEAKKTRNETENIRRKEIDSESFDFDSIEDPHTVEDTNDIDIKKMEEVLRNHFGDLTDLQKRIIISFSEGKKIKEIAEIEGVTSPTICIHIKRIRNKFEKILKNS